MSQRRQDGVRTVVVILVGSCCFAVMIAGVCLFFADESTIRSQLMAASVFAAGLLPLIGVIHWYYADIPLDPSLAAKRKQSVDALKWVLDVCISAAIGYSLVSAFVDISAPAKTDLQATLSCLSLVVSLVVPLVLMRLWRAAKLVYGFWLLFDFVAASIGCGVFVYVIGRFSNEVLGWPMSRQTESFMGMGACATSFPALRLWRVGPTAPNLDETKTI